MSIYYESAKQQLRKTCLAKTIFDSEQLNPPPSPLTRNSTMRITIFKQQTFCSELWSNRSCQTFLEFKASTKSRLFPMLSLAAAASGYVLNAPAPMAARARAVSMDAAKMECAAAAASNSLPASHSCAEPALSAAP